MEIASYIATLAKVDASVFSGLTGKTNIWI